MPYRWSDTLSKLPDPPGRPLRVLTLWPHRSLPPRGFAAFMAVTFLMFMVPLLGLLGQAALWWLLVYILGALALTWSLLRRSYRDAALREVLSIGANTARLVRTEPDGRQRHWEARTFWARVEIQAAGGPVENYLTLHGGPRVVEIGAFLAPAEREALRWELIRALAEALRPPEPADQPGR